MSGAGEARTSASRRGWEEIRAERMGLSEAQAGYDEARRAAEIGELIRGARAPAGLIQEALAARMGGPASAIAHLEAGALDTTTLDTLDKVAGALGPELVLSFRSPKAAG